MKLRFSVLDLLTVTTIIGVHIVLVPLAVASPSSVWPKYVVAIPTLVAIWLQMRLRLNLLLATSSHYLISLAWSFLYGLAYCSALNAYNSAHPSHGRTFLPFDWAIDDLTGMAVFGIYTSIAYLSVGYVVVGMTNHRISRLEANNQ